MIYPVMSNSTMLTQPRFMNLPQQQEFQILPAQNLQQVNISPYSVLRTGVNLGLGEFQDMRDLELRCKSLD